MNSSQAVDMLSGPACSIAAEKLFGPQVVGCLGGFDFTLLFEETILSVLPMSVVLLFLPVRIVHLFKSERKVYEGLLHNLKLLNLAFFAALQIALLVLWSSSYRHITTSSTVATTAVTVVGALSFCALSHLEHTRAVRPSLILGVYFFFTLIFDTARARTLWAIPDNRIPAIVFTTTVALKSLILLLEATEKRRLLRPMYTRYPPEATGSVFNQSFFWWLNPLLINGFGKVLSVDKLYPIDDDLAVDSAEEKLHSRWNRCNKENSNALLWVFVVHFKWYLASAIVPRLCLTAFTFAQPFLINRVIGYLTHFDSANDNKVGYGLIGAYCLVYTGIGISAANFQHQTYRVITMIRGNLVNLIYQRTLELSIISLDQSVATTLMSADVERIGTGMRQMHDVWAGLIEIGLAMWLLATQLGVAAVAAGIISLASTCAAVVVASGAGSRQKVWLEAIERRIGATASMLGAMKGVKMSGLTKDMSVNIQNLRNEEVASSRKLRLLLITIVNLSYTATAMAPVAAFGIYAFLARASNSGRTLDTATAFTSLALLELLAAPVSIVIDTLAGVMSAVGSFERIRKFLAAESRKDLRFIASMPSTRIKIDGLQENWSSHKEETKLEDWNEMTSIPKVSADTENCIIVENASVELGKSPVLKNLNFQLKRSQLSMIIGPVGCGKSTLLKALLGEIPTSSGSIRVAFSQAAYCSQSPWLTNENVQQNILGTSVMDTKWYDTVISACDLTADLKNFPRGDQSMVGSKGINLSGGQQMRLSLARALYARKRIMILDDILSGLDPTTEQTIFNALFEPEGICRRQGITVVLATNAVHRLSSADHIIALGPNGEILEQGTFKALNASGSAGYVNSLSLSSRAATEPSSTKADETAQVIRTSVDEAANKESEGDDSHSKDRRTGDLTVYKYYIETIGWGSWSIFVSLCCLYGFGSVFPQVWVKWWAEYNTSHPNEKIGFYLGIYGMIGGLTMLSLIFTTWHLIINMVPKSANRLHAILLETVLRAPMTFFATTDIGITTNRFSQDLELIDMELPLALIQTMLTAIMLIAQLLVIAFSAKYIAVALPFCLAVVWVIQKFYLRTSRQLRLLDIEAKSPLFTRFLESLGGLATIRAFGWQQEYLQRNKAVLQLSQRPYYLLYCIQRWLNLVLDLTVAIIAIILVVIAVKTRGKIDAGLIGLALVNIVNFSTNLKALITSWTVMETAIGAVSRTRSFAAETESENLPSETQMPPPDWPQNGAIEFRGVSASYRTSEPVLKALSFSAKTGERIGICGRSGSGKSSLLATLFRMLELDNGLILVDGVDISTIPRQEVRSKLIAIPQDPYLLTGTVRHNVDPLHSVSNEAIISALDKVQLWGMLKDKGGLDAQVDDELLSHGQRQLISLARAMVRKSTILVLDEATSSVDVKTDELMQKIIRTEFKKHTILAIAHRLDTIMDFDRVAVIDKGRLVEFDSPADLLKQPSAFKALYNSMNGDVMSHGQREDVKARAKERGVSAEEASDAATAMVSRTKREPMAREGRERRERRERRDRQERDSIVSRGDEALAEEFRTYWSVWNGFARRGSLWGRDSWAQDSRARESWARDNRARESWARDNRA